ncbi:MAG: hypothetical protein IJ639_12620 [Ruminococcus sp.]|nr:hypothetical protein [Ruminococcus sp.]
MKKNLLPQRFYALLLNDRQVEAGEGDIDGVHKIWGASYKISFLPFEDTTGRGIRTYKVAKEISHNVYEKISNVGWGSVLRLAVENHVITELEVMFDMSEFVIIE